MTFNGNAIISNIEIINYVAVDNKLIKIPLEVIIKITKIPKEELQEIKKEI